MTREKGKRQVSENSAGKPAAFVVSVPRRGRTGQRTPRNGFLQLKNRLNFLLQRSGACASLIAIRIWKFLVKRLVA